MNATAIDYPAPQESRTSYPLTPAEVVWMAKNLTQSAQNLILYCRAIDPFGNRNMEFQTDELARLFDCSRRTIQRAIAQLAELGLIDLEAVAFRLRGNLFGGNVVPLARSLSAGQKRRGDALFVAATTTATPPRQLRREQEPKPLLAKDSEEPKIIILPTSMKKEEREKPALPPEIDEEAYREWLIERAKALPNPPTLYERWADSQMMLGSNLRQYLSYLHGARRTGGGKFSAVAAPIPFTKENPVPTQPVVTTDAETADRLARLSLKWNMAFNQAANRKAVIEQIRDNGQAWGIALGSDGPYLIHQESEDDDAIDF